MINERIYLESPALRLVPYLPPHVPRYHEWMSDPDLLASTESEPLTLQEEFDNQHDWLQSLDKLTFILLAPLRTIFSHQLVHVREAGENGDINTTDGARLLTVTAPTGERHIPFSPVVCLPRPPLLIATAPDVAVINSPVSRLRDHLMATSSVVDFEKDHLHLHSDGGGGRPSLCPFQEVVSSYVPLTTKDLQNGHPVSHVKGKETFVMVGDCNLFLLPEEELDEDVPQVGLPSSQHLTTGSALQLIRPHASSYEVEVMLADPVFRRHGLAEEAVRLLMQYAVQVLGATRFVAKILDTNLASIKLFEQKLHFSAFNRVPVFHEIHLAREVMTEREREKWRCECAQHWEGVHSVCGPYTEEVERSMVVLPSIVPVIHSLGCDGNVEA